MSQNEHLLPFVPKFFGSGLSSEIKHLFTKDEFELVAKSKLTHYVILENMTKDINTDNQKLLDIKLGRILWTSTTDIQKIKHTIEKNSDSIVEDYHFRLDGAVLNGNILDKIKTQKCILKNRDLKG